MAALRKNKSKKQKKGKAIQEDYVDGEDPLETNGLNGHDEADGINLAAKAPEEATTEDVFAAPATKVKGGKGKPTKVEEKPVEDDGDGGTVKSKKEKENEKKEREKQRKKELVSNILGMSLNTHSLIILHA